MNENESFFDELQRDVDADHRSIDGADAPPADMWKSIRAQVKPESQEEEKTEMINSNAISQAPVPVTRPVAQPEGGVRHTLSLAASFLIVMSVALGGWFATMQLNQPGGSNGQFAFLGQSDESATCEAEPLSVDRVMEIVKNPYPFLTNGPAGEPTEPENPDSPHTSGLQEAGGWDVMLQIEGPSETPTEDVFETSSEFTNEYLECLAHGTLAQAWTFHTPIHIQQDVLWEFPVFADEEEVLASVEERLEMPARDVDSLNMWGRFIRDHEPATVRINPDPELSLQRRVVGSSFQYVLVQGVELKNADGQTTYLTSGTGSELIRGSSTTNYNMVVTTAWDVYSERWYIMPTWVQ